MCEFRSLTPKNDPMSMANGKQVMVTSRKDGHLDDGVSWTANTANNNISRKVYSHTEDLFGKNSICPIGLHI